MNSFRNKLQRFMAGRYGMDHLGRFLLWIVIGIIALNIFIRSDILWFAEIALLAYCYARMLSKDHIKRQRENDLYFKWRFRVTEALRRWKFKSDQTIHYHIYQCPNCGQKIRIPRGRGKVSIHCPKCHTDFIKRS